MKHIHLLILITLLGCNEGKNDMSLKYAPFSNSVIEIRNLRTVSDTIYIEARANTNIPRDGVESNILAIIDSGRYYLSIEIDRPVVSQVAINDEIYNILIEPSDTSEIIIKEKNGLEIGFNRRKEGINTYYLKKKESLGYTDIRYPLNQYLTSKSTYDSIKKSTDSIVGIEIAFMENYKKSNNLPSWFIDYEYSEITYSGASFKTMIPNYNQKFKMFSDSLPLDYFNYLQRIQINNQSAIFSSKYLWFLDDYFLREVPDDYDKLSGFARSSKFQSYILNQSKIELSGKPKDVYHKYGFSSLIKYYTDSLKIDSLAKEFELTDYKTLFKISGTKSKNGLNALNLNPGDTIPEFYVINELDSLISIKDFSAKILYINFWATWCGPCIKNIPALNEMIAEFADDDRIVFLNICLDSEKEKWPITISKYNLQGINLLAEGNWNSKLRSYFNIKGIPHYAIVRKNNVLEENFAGKAPTVKERIYEIRHTIE